MSMEACTVFTTALCNLNCSYCYICKDKNGGLAQIDKDIEDSFENNECIQSIINFDEETKNTLHSVCLWGGEPFLHMERFINHIRDWFNTFPNIDSFNTSTNFTIPNQIEKIKELLNAIELYGPKEKYSFELQISIDGYSEMNDFGRGEGVTQKILKNWKDLLKMQYNREKIYLSVTTKPTLSKATFKFLDTPEKCYKWYNFFDKEMYLPYAEANYPFNFNLSLFNWATPTEWSSEDGKDFAKIASYIAELNPKDFKGWSAYKSLLPMANMIIEMELDGYDISQPRCGGTCGAFISNIVPIPHGKYSVCHRGLFDNYVDYCNTTNSKEYMNGLSKSFFAPKDRNKWILNAEELRDMKNTMCKMNTCKNSVLYTDYLIAIREYARAGIIDKQYLDIETTKRTIKFQLGNSYCMQDGLLQNGSWTTPPTYEVPLLYNGAMEIAIKVTDEYMRKFGGRE